jgi:aminoglycoside phosphotransferase (APT) family kinase protein
MMQTLAKVQVGGFIARGLTSELYALGADRVVKLYLPWMRPEKAEWEFAVTKALHGAGLPVPQAFEIVEAKQRLGLVLERLHGVSMVRHTARRPWRLIAAARELAELQADLHSRTAPAELPTQRTQIEMWIAAAKDLSATDRAAAEMALGKLPDGDAICHGDFHPENVFYTSRGPMIIDWSTGTRGNPLGDVARTASLLKRAEIPPDWSFYLRALVVVSRRLLLRFYLRRYFELRPGRIEDLHEWEPIQKAAISAWRARMDGFQPPV